MIACKYSKGKQKKRSEIKKKSRTFVFNVKKRKKNERKKFKWNDVKERNKKMFFYFIFRLEKWIFWRWKRKNTARRIFSSFAWVLSKYAFKYVFFSSLFHEKAWKCGFAMKDDNNVRGERKKPSTHPTTTKLSSFFQFQKRKSINSFLVLFPKECKKIFSFFLHSVRKKVFIRCFSFPRAYFRWVNLNPI